MSYLVLARKYRPMVFGEVVAQEHVTRTLVNALAAGRTSHAYIFSGPRGVGKTSTARLLARAVNCKNPAGQDPCNVCENCRAITVGNSLDVLEIDGASNRGIDEIRDLRERVGYAPAVCRYKIYIIDEVHMLTQEAFNALLKTLEEPPSHVIFIFATTAPHKVPLTILSRCQRFDFKAVPTVSIVEQLEKVLAAEKIGMNREVVEMIARKADGAMRDALSLCDQVIAFCDGDYTVEKASQVLGILDAELFLELSRLVAARDTLAVVQFVDRLAENGVDLEEFYAELARHYRHLIMFKLGVKDPSALDIPSTHADSYAEISRGFDLEDLVRSLQLVLGFEETFKFSGQQKITLELLLIRLTMLEKSVNISELIGRLEQGRTAVVQNVQQARSAPDQTSAAQSAGPAGGYSSAPAGEPEIRSTSDTAGRKSELPDREAVTPLVAEGQEVDLGVIRHHWPGLVDKVKNVSRKLWSALGSAEPVSYENGRLVLAAPGNAYTLDLLSRPDSRQAISDVIRRSFRLDSVSVEIVPTREEAGPGVKREREGSNPSTESFDQLCRNSPLMGKIKDLFDPELIS
ncbi:MAG: DNA polymerase III subunit gamma/tau [Candidatus Glassbacteria bacterium]